MDKLKDFFVKNDLNSFLKFFVENHKKIKKNRNNILKLNNSITQIFIKNNISSIILNGNQEINNLNGTKVKYHIIKTDTNIKKQAFLVYISLYYLLSKTIKMEYILPLDFEFNTKKIALMQLNFETDFNDRFIFIIYPPDLNYYWNSFFIKKILGNKNILKILHGSDSLDIPYMFTELIKNRKYIKKFIHSFIDTRYFCEYYNYQNNLLDRKCKIYEFLFDQKIISKKKLKYLEDNSEKMGNISDIFIEIDNISDELLKYTLYDVLFLKYLYKNFPKNNLFYDKLIPEITRLIFLERRNIINNLDTLTKNINTMNNYFIIENNNNLRLIDIYNLYSNYLNLKEYSIDTFEKINYFKNTIELIKKYIIYINITRKYNVYVKSKILYKENLNLNLKLSNKRYKNINKIIKMMNYEIKNTI